MYPALEIQVLSSVANSQFSLSLKFSILAMLRSNISSAKYGVLTNSCLGAVWVGRGSESIIQIDKGKLGLPAGGAVLSA